jgi:hypothetical protein
MSKKIGLLALVATVGVLVFAVMLSFSAQTGFASGGQWPAWDLRDGRYRGSFSEMDETPVSLEITVKGGEITEILWRHMAYRGQKYLKPANPMMEGLRDQYMQCAEFLIGAKGVDEIVGRLEYMIGSPTGPALEAIKTQKADAFTAATIRASKIRSAVVDAFNRGIYRP